VKPRRPLRANAADTGLWLLRAIERNPGHNAVALARIAGTTHQSAYPALDTLKRHGFVRFVDTDKRGRRYFTTNPPPGPTPAGSRS
jgi:DNA-binding IclR family transcriptional regulator